jgi:hypothetical protein
MNAIEQIQTMTPAAFAALGMEQIAYIKPIVVDGQTGFGIYTANGQQVAVMPNRDLAIEAVRQNDLAPLLVH